ncbi:MAG: SPASM domain-containing protein [Thermodesulfovibrionales bacterium]|nr:SPASM domain-containing protein [Thermodesulfovibrionales bacterium]
MLTTLKYIQFFPTFKCNFNCSFCFNRNISLPDEMRLDRLDLFIKIISELGIQELDILGGEPTLYSYLYPLIDSALQNNIHIFLSTNGSNIDILKRFSLRYSNSEPFTIGISINHEKLSSDLYRFILKYLPVLKGVVFKDRILSKAAESIISEHPEIRYYQIFFDPLSKRDLKNSLSFPNYYEITSKLKRKYKNVEKVFCSGFIVSDRSDSLLQRVRCPAGTSKLSVMPDGSVYPCYLFFRHSEFKLGNLFEDIFEKIWRSPILDFFRNFNGNSCSLMTCKFHKNCHGGCPAISLLIYNDLKRGDPRCKENFRTSSISSVL